MLADRLTVGLRPRDNWEAIDLGTRLAIVHGRVVYAVWLIVAAPIAVGLALALPQRPWIAAAAFWWLKPAFARFVLHVLAQAVFGTPPGIAATFKAWRSVLAVGLPGALLWRRWDPARSFHMPVNQLERQVGRAASRRRALLGRRTWGHGVALTLILFACQFVVMGSLLMAASLLVPAGWIADTDPTASWWEQLDWFDSAAFMIGASAIEPIYVGAGFALYLNRRVLLEGWDVEVALRRLEQRLASAATTPSSRGASGLPALMLALVVAAVAASSSTSAQAQAQAAPAAPQKRDAPGSPLSAGNTPSQAKPGAPHAIETPPAIDLPPPADPPSTEPPPKGPTLPKSDARRAIDAILAEPEFPHRHDVERWRPKRKEADARPDPAKPAAWLTALVDVFASAGRVVGWAVAIVALAFVLRAVLKRLASIERDGRYVPPAILFGLAIAPESLPDDVGAVARERLAAGDLRGALSLLYRATLSRLVHDHGVRLEAGSTEGDAVAAATERLDADGAGVVAQLVRAWSTLAYGARAPRVDEVGALVDAWDSAFGRRAVPAA